MDKRSQMGGPEASNGGHEIKRTGSTSSNYSNINANLHARVKAFQEQRQLKRNGSVGSGNTGNSSNGSKPEGSGESQNIDKIVNKPLPPLPPSKEGGQVLSPIRRAPRPPAVATAGPGIAAARPSLSARRGLKLPAGGMSLKMKPPATQEFAGTPSNRNSAAAAAAGLGANNASQAGRRSNPGSLVNGIQTTSTSSGLQRDTEGTAPSQQQSQIQQQQQQQQQQSRTGSNGLFTNFSKYVDIKSGSLNFAGKLSLSSQGVDFSNGSSFRITLDELEFLEELGHGNYGNVSKVLHKPTNVIMAMKEVRLELDESKFTQILMELEVLHKCQSPYIVDFYGAFFIEGAVYMCMEYMDGGSLDKSYDSDVLGGIDEPELAFIANAIIQGLKELKDVHNIIHRDVKPTNVLCSAAQGTVKLCDFGVSGNLVASLAKTNIGCQSYMAPERIKSFNPDKATYTVQSDIWSLGLSILEMAIGTYPYPVETFDNIFSQLSAIVDSPPPQLPKGRFSPMAQDFVNMCLQKIPERRRNYAALLEHPWLKTHHLSEVNMSEYIANRLERKRVATEESGSEPTKSIPALHKGGL